MRWVGLIRNVMIGREGLDRVTLLALLADAGGLNGRSHLATGNVTFAAAEDDLPAIVGRLEAGIATVIGREEPVIVRSRDMLAELVERNPFEAVDTEGVELLVGFLGREVAPVTAADIGDTAPSVIVGVTGRELMMVRPARGRPAPHAGPVLERASGHKATTRAWSTVVRLAAAE